MKAEVARADPQLVRQVGPMSLVIPAGLVQLGDSCRMLTVPLGGRGRDAEAMPVAFAQCTRLHGEPGVDRAKEEVRYKWVAGVV